MNKSYYVYMLTNKTNRVLYVGVTNNLVRRVEEHRSGLIDGFTKKYNLKKLVYAEECDDAYYAIKREKELKGWLRRKKDQLINEINSRWDDLADQL